MPRNPRLLILGLLVASVALLVPGVFLPALTIQGALTRDGVAQIAPVMLERGLTDDTIGVLRSMMNPAVIAFLEATGGNLRSMIIDQLGPQISAALQANVPEVVIYEQRRSILGAVQRLYEVGSPVPATLILLFSVIVPLGKAVLVAWAVSLTDAFRRRRTMRFVETIAKWSMADVFVVALLIAWLAAQASATPTSGPEAAPALIAFTAAFGPGFYWFAAYCVFSLAAHQISVRLASTAPEGISPAEGARGTTSDVTRTA